MSGDGGAQGAAGNTATAIPVLERLRDSGFSLPEEFKP
jgi:hypothetical protein